MHMHTHTHTHAHAHLHTQTHIHTHASYHAEIPALAYFQALDVGQLGKHPKGQIRSIAKYFLGPETPDANANTIF